MTYQIRRVTDTYYSTVKVLATADTLTDARLKAVRLLKKYHWKPRKSENFASLEIVDPSKGIWGLMGDVAINRNGIALWFAGGNKCHVIYKNGRIGPETRFYDGKYDKF